MVGLYDDSSSSSSSSAVEEIISEAKDSILLQQISAINCASFTHSHLPTDLESRFNKLKSFPANHTPPPPYYHHHPTPNSTSTPTLPPNPTNTSPSKSSPIQNHPHSASLSSPSQNNNNLLKPLPKPKQKQPSLSPSSSSSHTSEDSSLFMPTAKTEKHKLSKQNSLWGCFWFSPKKKSSSRSSKEENVLGLEFDSTDKILSGLGSLSMKEHQKVIKKAMKEEEKISREAEKIVEWAKHVSARINISDIEDELSDN